MDEIMDCLRVLSFRESVNIQQIKSHIYQYLFSNKYPKNLIGQNQSLYMCLSRQFSEKHLVSIEKICYDRLHIKKSRYCHNKNRYILYYDKCVTRIIFTRFAQSQTFERPKIAKYLGASKSKDQISLRLPIPYGDEAQPDY